MRFGWICILVKDMAPSLSFYQRIMGLKIKRKVNPVPGTEIVFLGFGGEETEIELIQNDKIKKPDYGPDFNIGFQVESIDRQIQRLQTNAIVFTGPFQPSPEIKFIYVKDPDGLKVQFFEKIEL